jgi:hypothetical protein
VFAVPDQMTAAHSTYQHWYLPWFGVGPAGQGRQLGTSLMTSCLVIVDRSHLPAYLETPNPTCWTRLWISKPRRVRRVTFT